MKWTSVRLVVVLVALQLRPASGSISGIVIKAGTAIRQPLQDARLELTGGRGAKLVLRSDAGGRFVFTDLAPGEYRLAVTCDGFIRQETAKWIVLSAEQPVRSLSFEMEPAPTAAGWVLDRYGEPISNVLVEARRRSYDVRGNARMARAATALTNDRGEYRIFWLDPGEYFFYAASVVTDAGDGQPTRAVEPTYFPGVNTPEEAKAVRLDVGREIRVDFRLRPAGLWTVRGQTMNGVTSQSIVATITLTPPAADPSFARYHAQSSADGRFRGEFVIGSVAPGTYILTAKSGTGDRQLTVVQRIEIRPVLIPPPSYGVSLALIPPLFINGRLFLQSQESADLRQANVALLAIDPDLPSPRSVFPRQDGQFVLNGIVPGGYVLEIYNLPQDFYVKAARFGTTDVLEKPLTLEASDTANPLQILIGSDGGRLQVTVYNGGGGFQSGSQVVVVPDAPRRARREQYRLGNSDEDGQTSLRGIPPGSYRVFAWEEMEPNAYLNPDYLRAYEAQGIPVTINSGDNPPLSVRVIPKG